MPGLREKASAACREQELKEYLERQKHTEKWN